MLRNILIISSSGLPIFCKGFANPVVEKESLIGGLLITMLNAGKKHTGRKVSHIEFETVSLTMMGDDDAGLYCAVFLDVTDGYEFGKLLAAQILIKFVQVHGKKISLSNTQQYESFGLKLPEVFRSMVNPIIRNLKNQRGIKHVSLITTGSVGTRSVLQSTNTDYSLSANLNILISRSKDLMNSALDHPQIIKLETESMNVQIIQVEPLSHLVVLCQKNADQKQADIHIRDTVDLIKKVYILLTNVQNV